MASPLAFILPGILLLLMAVTMLEQSVGWVAAALLRRHFTTTQFAIDHLRDQPGTGGFALQGHIASTGELIHTTDTHPVSLERFRELDAAGRIP